MGDENELDEIALIELKKQKRLLQLKTDESKKSKGEKDEMQIEKDQLAYEDISGDHFLTASPDIGLAENYDYHQLEL